MGIIAASSSSTKRVLILGSTGSIGVQTLEVIDHLNALYLKGESSVRYEVVGMAAGSNCQQLITQAREFGVRDIAIANLFEEFDLSEFRVRTGNNAARKLVEDVSCDLVVGAIVGIAGLDSVYRAIELGIDVALANKETLVAAGSLVIQAARKSGAKLFPVDSEHAGVWQCLQSLSDNYCPPTQAPSSVERVILTASGGPFRTHTRNQIENASLTDALNHPNWTMGAKVTIDSATLMNKALELIEAHWLFGLDAQSLDAVIHPQSIVHAMIECTDSSVIAQLGAPDMKAPIQHALCSPDRSQGCAKKLDVTKLSRLDFIEIDQDRFPAIKLAMDTIRSGGNTGAAFNAANEQAVVAFLDNRLPFGMIDRSVAQVMGQWDTRPINSIEDVYAADAQARECMNRLCSKSVGGSK